MSTRPTLDIVLPCYNPRPGWDTSLSENLTDIKSMFEDGVLQNVIIVNDGSETGITGEMISALISDHREVKVIEYPRNRGKGYAVRTGIKSSEADLQIFTDIDIPYTNESIKAFYEVLDNKKADVVVTSRGDSYYNSLSLFRKLLSKSLRWLNGFLFGLQINDTQGGLKGFNAGGKEVFLTTSIDGYLFDLEFIQKASNNDIGIVTLEVPLKPNIALPSPKPMILLRELRNFISLFFSR